MVIHETLTEPSVQRHKNKTLVINEISEIRYWRGPLIRYILNGELPQDPKERARMRRRVCSFSLIGDILYKRGFAIPLIRCLGPIESQEALEETHEGIYGQHLGAKVLAKKVL